MLDTLVIQGGLPDGMGDPNLAPVLPGLIKGLADGSADEAVAAFYKTYNSGGPTSSPLDIVDDCQNRDFMHPGIQHSASDRGGLFTGWSLKRYCDLIGSVPQYPAIPNVTSDVPVLAVVSAYDVLSSESNATAIFAGFANTKVVAVPGISNVYSQLHDCWVATLTAFVDNPNGPTDTTCLTSPAVTTLK